jgi:hypothetical protein
MRLRETGGEWERPLCSDPFPGCARGRKHAGRAEDIGAVALELTPADLREIDAVASTIEVQGARYPEKLEKMTGG